MAEWGSRRHHLTVEAGIKVEDLMKALTEKNQKALLKGRGTLGGLLAMNPALNPRLRDQVLGMRVIFPGGIA